MNGGSSCLCVLDHLSKAHVFCHQKRDGKPADHFHDPVEQGKKRIAHAGQYAPDHVDEPQSEVEEACDPRHDAYGGRDAFRISEHSELQQGISRREGNGSRGIQGIIFKR